MNIWPFAERLLEHPLAGFAIAAALCLYHPLVLRLGKRVFQVFFHEELADGNLMKQIRMLGSELSTLSIAAMLKAFLDSKSGLSHDIAILVPHPNWVFYSWLALLYIVFIFTPSVFVRYALLERDQGQHETNEEWSLFTWRWTLVGWLLGFVNLHIALRFLVV